MSIAAKGISLSRSRPETRRVAALTLSNNYVTGGDTLDLTALTNPNGIDGMKQFTKLPKFFEVLNQPTGFNVQIIPGTTLKNNLLKIWDEVAGAQLAQAAYPAGLLGADAILIAFDTLQGA